MNAKKIQDVFGTKKMADIRDDAVVHFFAGQMEQMLMKPYKKWKAANPAVLQECIEKYKRPYVSWPLHMLAYLRNQEGIKHVPVVLDIEDIIDAIPKDANNHRQRVIKSFRDALTENDELGRLVVI